MSPPCTDTFPGSRHSRLHFALVVIVQILNYILDVVVWKNMQAEVRQTGHYARLLMC